MNAILQSIDDRSNIKATFHNIKLNFKEIRSYEKILSTEYLAKDIDINKTRKHINKLIDEAVTLLHGITPACALYSQMFSSEYEEVKTALHKIVKRQPLN